MAITTTTVSVDDSAAVLLFAPTGSKGDESPGAIHNETGGDTLYVGGSDVTSSDGIPIAAGTTMNVTELLPGEDIYGICASAETATARVMQGRQ